MGLLSGGNSAPQAGAWRGHEPPSPRRGARCRGDGESIPLAREAGFLILAAGILSGGGGSMAADGQETETDGSRSAGQSPSLTDASSRNPIAGLRGGSAARSPLCPDVGGQSEREKKAENKAVSGRSAVGVTVAAAASGDVSEFIPILPADVASLSGGGQAAGGQSVTVFRSLGSKTDPVLHVRFPAPWSVVVQNRAISNWRRLLALVRTAVLGDE